MRLFEHVALSELGRAGQCLLDIRHCHLPSFPSILHCGSTLLGTRKDATTYQIRSDYISSSHTRLIRCM